jgi:aminoglycoside phosphotransferase (APT) family kinase protein
MTEAQQRERAALARYLAERLGADDGVELEGPDRIATGNSRRMLSASVRFTQGGEARNEDYVIRVEQGGVFGTGSEREVAVMRAAREAGLPVARIRWLETGSDCLGAPFFVMDRVHGLGANPGMGSIRDYVRWTREQHALDWKAAGLDFLPTPSAGPEAAILEIDHWDQIHRDARFLPVPLLEETAAWLRRNAPDTERIALIHGDPGAGNYMFEGDSVTAITDWEFAHLGDPDEDWVYMATIRGSGVMPVDAWRSFLAEEAGVAISDERWRYWDVFNRFKGACANLTALRIFVEGTNPAPNMAAVGTSLHLLFLTQIADLVGAN